ncbi:short-chain dehydrogenase [Mycolicibacterium litorale]|nr:short-chain dehydrogenase [Mycolicibacterium litorale]
MTNLRSRYGQYAIVTGASSGIGEQFARQLAAAGMDLVVVARRKDRLEALAAELSRAHGITTIVIVLDLLADGAVEQLYSEVGDLDVGIVVANAGISSVGAFLDHSLQDELDVLALNGAVPLRLAHQFGRMFVGQGRGAIILVSSTIAAGAIPFLANYAAVKAYVLSLGQALNYELKETGVDVLVVSPGPTRTDGHAKAGLDVAGASVMNPSRVAAAALKNVGKRSHVIPGTSNKIADVMSRYFTPRWLSTRLYGWLFGRAIRQKHAPHHPMSH